VAQRYGLSPSRCATREPFNNDTGAATTKTNNLHLSTAAASCRSFQPLVNIQSARVVRIQSARTALRRPDRVAGLLLYGTSASGRWSPATPWALHQSAIDHWLERLADPAHYDEGLRRFAPSAADDPHVQAWYARLLRNAASKGGVRALLQAFHATDLSARLSQVRVPTLVLQRRGDRVVPWAAGEQLARGIPGATLEALDGEDHFLWHGDRGALLRAVERFVAQHAARAPRLAA
jgi:pimeloyl-ACP methyl ester carboxylesterase